MLRRLAEADPRTRSKLEGALLFLACLLLAAWPVREALLDPSRILLEVDSIAAHPPWSTTFPDDGVARPRNPDFAGEGLVLYPAYRFVAESWRAGDPPLWNPFTEIGVPSAAVPRTGAFDPQVLVLAGLDALGGRALFDWGFALLAWLRLAAAALGAYLLARRLLIPRAGAALAAISFAGSGAIVLGVTASAGHVAFLLPWLLLGLESTRGARPHAGVAGAAVALALALLGGDPPSALVVGACGVAWTIAIGREHRLAGARCLFGLALGLGLSSFFLIPHLAGLRDSGALEWGRSSSTPWPDLLSLGLLVIGCGVVLRWRSMQARASDAPATAWRDAFGAAALFALLFAGIAMLAGVLPGSSLVLAPELFGRAPGAYVGPGPFADGARAWLPLVSLALALSAVLAPGASGSRRGALIAIGAPALLLALRAPGAVDLFHRLPLVGSASVAPFAVVSALALSLLAGHGLASGSRAARLASALALGLVLVVARDDGAPQEPPPSALVPDPPDGLVAFTRLPPPELGGEAGVIAGWLHPSVPARSLRLRVQRVNFFDGSVADATEFESAGEFVAEDAKLEPARVPEGARHFRARFEGAPRFPACTLRYSLDLFGEHGERIGSRVAAFAKVRREPRWTSSWLAVALASLALVAVLPLASNGSSLLIGLAACALALVQVRAFAEGLHPAIPRAEIFPACRTVELLARELGAHRFVAEPGVLPPLTALPARLRFAGAVHGRDEIDRGLDLAGVSMLALSAPIEVAGWDLVAGPDASAPELAELYLYRARNPSPRAYCVSRAIAGDVPLAERESDPRAVVRLEAGESWQPPAPFEHAHVEELRWRNTEVALRAALDGSGLLVLGDAYAPGWSADVDGKLERVLRANGAFRAVALGPGEHAVVFRYHPPGMRAGIAIATVAAIAVFFLALAGGTPRRGQALRPG